MHDIVHSRSTPDLVAVAAQAAGAHGGSKASHGGSRLKRTTAGAQAGAGAAVLPGFGRSHSTSSLTALRRHGSLRAAGFPDFSLQLSPGLVKQAEEMAIESSQAGGIFLNAECHELYGNPESAPELRGAPGNQSQPSELSKLADCLSTPFTADDKNLGELVKAESRAQALRARAQISERFVLELGGKQQQQQQDYAVEDEPAAAEAAAAEDRNSPRDPRGSRSRKRRESGDIYQFLAGLGINVEPTEADWRPDSSGPLASSEDAAALSSMYMSYDDSSNMLSMDQAEQPLTSLHSGHGALATNQAPEDVFAPHRQTPPLDHATPSRHPLSV